MAKSTIAQSKLEALYNQELILNSKITNLGSDIEQWQISIQALKSDVKLPIASGISSVFDALKTQLDSAESEQEKQIKLLQYEDAIYISKASLEVLKNELIAIQKDIKIEKANEYFDINIKPHYSKYEKAFTKFEDEKQDKIISILKDLADYRSDYELIRRFTAGDKSARLERLNFNSNNPQKRFQRLEQEFIPGCEKNLADIEVQPLPENLDSPDFRAWLTSRVLLNESLEHLIKANDEALQAQREFRKLAAEYPECLEFNLFELTSIMQVIQIDSKEKITLTTKEI